MSEQIKNESLYIEISKDDPKMGDTSERWAKTVKDTNEHYAPALGFEEEPRMKALFQQSFWALSWAKGAKVSDIAELSYDGDFFDDVFDLIPDGKRKDKVIDELTAMSDEDARKLSALVN